MHKGTSVNYYAFFVAVHECNRRDLRACDLPERPEKQLVRICLNHKLEMTLSGFSKVIFHSMGDGFAFVKLQIKRKKKANHGTAVAVFGWVVLCCFVALRL